MGDVRTPEDEIDKPGYFYPPFKEGWWYEGITYGGHSDYSVDWNRRIKDPKRGWVWKQDAGDPVFAQADGTVSEIEREGGAVYINHYGGLWRTESRHMTDIKVKVGDKVKRGDRIGSIGKVGVVAAVPSEHLHVVHWKRDSVTKPFERTKQSFNGKNIRTSVYNSDSKPSTWDAPEAEYVQGPPPRATWESAFKELNKKYTTSQVLIQSLREQISQAPAGDTELQAKLDTALAELSDLQVDFDNLEDQHLALTTKWNALGVAIDNVVDVYGE